MTGFYLRVKRNGEYVNLDIAEMTDQELQDFAMSQPVNRGWTWAIALAQWIRDNVKVESHDD